MADIATAHTEDFMHSVYDGDFKMLESVHCCALILGPIFSSSPHEPQCRQAIDGLDAMDPTEEWPLGNKEDLVEASDLIQKGALDYDGLCEEYGRQFIGPEHFEAPQWASVYLDPDSIVFGCAHLELRQWMRTHRIYPEHTSSTREAADSFGKEMLLLAWIADRKPDLICDLVANHIMPWAPRYLELLRTSSRQPFWAGAALLASTFLSSLSKSLGITPATRKLFR